MLCQEHRETRNDHAQRVLRCARPGRKVMLKWGIFFLLVALVAGVLGFTGIAGAAGTIAKIIFGVAIILFIIALLVGRSLLS